MNILFTIPMLTIYVGAIDAGSPIGPVQEHPPTPGCRLNLNNGHLELEPIGDPLLIHVRMRVFHFRDIPDGGGSFSVDFG